MLVDLRLPERDNLFFTDAEVGPPAHRSEGFHRCNLTPRSNRQVDYSQVDYHSKFAFASVPKALEGMLGPAGSFPRAPERTGLPQESVQGSGIPGLPSLARMTGPIGLDSAFRGREAMPKREPGDLQENGAGWCRDE